MARPAGNDFLVVRVFVRRGITVWLATRAGKLVEESISPRKNDAVRVARTLAKRANVSYWVQRGTKFDKGN